MVSTSVGVAMMLHNWFPSRSTYHHRGIFSSSINSILIEILIRGKYWMVYHHFPMITTIMISVLLLMTQVAEKVCHPVARKVISYKCEIPMMSIERFGFNKFSL